MNGSFKKLIFLVGFLIFSLYFSYFMVKTNNLAFKIFTFEKNESKLWIETNQIEYVYLNSPKIFCIILTSKNSLKTKAKTIYNTWAKKCDNFKFITLLPQGLFSNDNFTNQTNFISTEYDYKYYNTWLQPPGLFEDEYSKLTNKIYLAYKYISVNYSEYDWYLKADDDTFIFVDNLKKFVSKKNSSTPVTYGYDFKVIVDKGYHSGGGGYLMSNEAFRRIGSKLNEDFKYCPNTGTEDVDVAKCFRSLEVYPEKSVDELGRERFHPLNIHGHYQGDYPDWMYTYASNPLKKGLDCCSDTSISFHYMTYEEIVKAQNVLEKKSAKTFKFQEFLNYYL